MSRGLLRIDRCAAIQITCITKQCVNLRAVRVFTFVCIHVIPHLCIFSEHNNWFAWKLMMIKLISYAQQIHIALSTFCNARVVTHYECIYAHTFLFVFQRQLQCKPALHYG